MKQTIIQTIQNYNLIQKDDHIVVGVSGGPDSMCLLHILQQIQKENSLSIPFTLCVAHIHHGIRKEADEEEQYVKEYCDKTNIPFFAQHVKVEEIAKQKKIGTEEAGRQVRYAFFEEIANLVKATKIATAHNANDRAETVIMNLLRGSGIAGLGSIPVQHSQKYIRPLLACTRKEIEEYCEQEQLHPKIDQTNQENMYTRNKIRNQCIPYLEKEFNPNLIQTLNRLADIATQENEYLEKQTQLAYDQICMEQTQEQIILDLKQFNLLDLVIKNRIVLYTIKRLFGSSSGIEKRHIQDIIQLCGNTIGNKFLIPNKKVKILVKNKQIAFIKNQMFRK